MKDGRINTTYVSCPSKFYDMLLSGKVDVQSWDFVNEDVLHVTHRQTTGFLQQNLTVNVVLAA